MTLTQSDVSELLDAIRAGGDIDVIRKGVELVLQALIEGEATEAIGAERYERSDSRTNQRNGGRSRLLTTKAGDVELRIPKLRRGSFFPSILERRRRIDRALCSVVADACVHGGRGSGASRLDRCVPEPATGHRPPATGHRPPATGHRPHWRRAQQAWGHHSAARVVAALGGDCGGAHPV